MKRKGIGIMLGLLLFAGAFYPMQEVSAEQETETETETEKAEDFTVTMGDTDRTVSNTSGVSIAEAAYEKEDGEETGTLTLTQEDGDVHTFEEAPEETWTDPELYEEYGFLYLTYQDSQKETKELLETADEKELEEETTVYALSNVNIREEPDQESERLSGVQTGDSLTVTGVVPGWLKIETGETQGYVAHRYFTEDEKEAQEAKEKAQQAAEAAAATESVSYTCETTAQTAAAETSAQKTSSKQTEATEAAAETTAQTSAPETTAETSAPETTAETAAAETSAPTIVSSQDYDDCDGSGHGYREITWSDGSVTYEDY